MKEYDFVDTIVKQTKTPGGQMAGLLDAHYAKKILDAKAKEGWTVHTFFHNDKGTCLLQRDSQAIVTLKDLRALMHDIRTQGFKNNEQNIKLIDVVCTAIKRAEMPWYKKLLKNLTKPNKMA